VGKLVQD